MGGGGPSTAAFRSYASGVNDERRGSIVSWDDLNIPDAWMATSMLRSMVADHLVPDKPFDSTIDEDTRQRMVVLAIMGHLEVADKTARLIEQFSALISEFGELADRHNKVLQAVSQLAELIDEVRDA